MTIDGIQTKEELFSLRYAELNKEQKHAVDAIYGPVMVIAGPGTGKTEVLAMRIANLLRSDAQVQPHEILCLTYTDEATNAMRRRLVQIIGAVAHRVNIYTFHAFCNNIIQNNSSYFSVRNLQPVTDLERTELLYQILEELPQGHPLRKLSGNIYYDAGKLFRLFELMKRENIRRDDIITAADRYLKELPTRDEYIYKVNSKAGKKGEVKQNKINEEAQKMATTCAAAGLFEVYEAKMQQAGRYDFADMIIWVLDAFKKHPTLLQNYQERFQFILVDEFQDTNGSQNEILNALTAYWGEDPNIFVVGDDDQSIYEFQGARIRNIIDFYGRYKDNITTIVLPQNYRSSQAILDKAMMCIQNNQQRLIYQLQELQLNKNIVAASARFKDGKDTIMPVVAEYANTLQEEADIIMQIEKLRHEGIALNDIAILYAQHKQAENIIALMERKGIPYNVKKPVNILLMPVIQQVIGLLKYLVAEQNEAFSGEYILFEIMHAPFFDVAPADTALLSLYIQQNRQKDKSLGYWRLVLSNKLLLESLNLSSSKALIRLGKNIEAWLQGQLSLTLPMLVEKIVYESGIVHHILQHKEKVWLMQVLNTFFEFVKDSYNRNPRISPTALLRMLEQMDDENIALPVQKVVQHDNGVHFYTTHGAKGNEFEYVFLIGCNKTFWEENRTTNNSFTLPDTLTRTIEDTEKTYKIEVSRRLFYVALTRAKKHLHISYASTNNDGKSIEPSVFIDEISTVNERKRQLLPADNIVKHIEWALTPVSDVRIELANHTWLERSLQQFTMSYTTLCKYLNCPLAFYYEHLLKAPILKSDALAFGSAVHEALEYMFRTMKEKSGAFPSKEQVLKIFTAVMYSESASFTPAQFERRMEQGQAIMTEYYDTYIDQFEKTVEVEYRIPRYLLNNIPVTGKIDKIEFQGNNCVVVDYKTGNPDNASNSMTAPPNEKNPLGGDYWRQMVFYKIIVENYPELSWKITAGRFEYIEKSKKDNVYKQIYIPIYAQDEEIVMKQLKDAYTGIMNHDFDKGCGKKDCQWCNFARSYEIITPVAAEEPELDDI